MSTHFLFTAQAHHKSRTLGEADVTAVDSVKVAELKKAAADGLITAAELDEALADCFMSLGCCIEQNRVANIGQGVYISSCFKQQLDKLNITHHHGIV